MRVGESYGPPGIGLPGSPSPAYTLAFERLGLRDSSAEGV